MDLSRLTYTELLRSEDNLEHICESATDASVLRSARANLARIQKEIAVREAKGLTHISYAEHGPNVVDLNPFDN